MISFRLLSLLLLCQMFKSIWGFTHRGIITLQKKNELFLCGVVVMNQKKQICRYTPAMLSCTAPAAADYKIQSQH